MLRATVSTITPCYRMKRYLKRFLDELPQQTAFESLEVVLDHNDPDPEEVQWVREFQAKYPGHLKHIVVNPVEPIGTSMNRCISQASGEFLAIWNVDDLRTPTSIKDQLTEMQKVPKVDVVYGDYVVVRQFGATSGIEVRHEAFSESELTRSMILGPFVMFRKSLCERAGYFDEQLKSGADFDFAVRLAFHGKAARSDRKLGYYLNEGLGASTRPNSLQPIERTVIELRYGIYDKIDYTHLPEAVRYNVSYLLKDGEYTHVEHFVPHYSELLAERRSKWFRKGFDHYVRQHAPTAILLNKIRTRIKSIFD